MTSSYGRILSVDDEASVRTRIVSYLEDSGFTLYEASNGEEALTVFRAQKPDLVLSDLQMPVMGGLELLEILNKESPETPVIVISSSHIMSDVIDALRLGAWDYIEKPITNMPVLEHVVCKALERGRLVVENKKYRLELEEKNLQLLQSLTQLKEDQKAGKWVQQQLLPLCDIQYENYLISYKVIPSLYLSGDFLNYFQINKDKIGIYLLDVAGHGASSAFVTILLKSLIEQILINYQMGRDDTILHPEKVLKFVNDNILKAKLGKYLTMIYCTLDIHENSLCYSIGGHYPSPIIWDGTRAYFLKGKGFAVGMVKEAQFESNYFSLPTSFVLAMFSDGIFEIMKGKNLEENENKLLALINKLPFHIKDIETYFAIKGDEGFPDDITFLLINKKTAGEKRDHG